VDTCSTCLITDLFIQNEDGRNNDKIGFRNRTNDRLQIKTRFSASGWIAINLFRVLSKKGTPRQTSPPEIWLSEFFRGSCYLLKYGSYLSDLASYLNDLFQIQK
jgi:hypothetical protein